MNAQQDTKGQKVGFSSNDLILRYHSLLSITRLRKDNKIKRVWYASETKTDRKTESRCSLMGQNNQPGTARKTRERWEESNTERKGRMRERFKSRPTLPNRGIYRDTHAMENRMRDESKDKQKKTTMTR